jgi:hypothetical protein
MPFRSWRLFHLWLISQVLLGGCALATDPVDVHVAGCWNEAFSIPGAGINLQLSEAGSSITGSGHFSIEAGPSGDLTAAGERAGADFSLTLTYDIGLVRPLSATIRNSNRFDAYPIDATGQRQATPQEFRRCD